MTKQTIRCSENQGNGRWGPGGRRLSHCRVFACLTPFALTHIAAAGQITFAGFITQSTQDGTGTAMNSPGLNNISDGDAHTVTLNFKGFINSPGTYVLAGATLAFFALLAPVSETAFNSVSLTISPDGSNADISLLGCLIRGGGLFGNQLGANLSIPLAALNSQNVPAQAVFGLVPPWLYCSAETKRRSLQ